MGIELRLSRVLAKELQRLGSYDRLAAEIRLANAARKDKGRPDGVDRRKLKRIIEGTGYSLSPRDLEALDTYLTPLGEGLADQPLLVEREGILPALVRSGKVTVAFGARPLKDRYYVGLWDVKTSAVILNAIYRVRPAVVVDIQSAENSDPVDQKAVESLLRTVEDETASEDKKAALCCIGSPRSSPLAEAMLCEMFGVSQERFRRPTPQGSPLPFLFVWPTDSGVGHPPTGGTFRSRFALRAQDLEDESLADAVKEGKAYAFVHRREIRPAYFPEAISKDYGVVVAQRRSNGQVWLVIAGLSGPGTFAAARAVESKIAASLPEAVSGGHGPTLYAVIEAEVQNSGEPGEHREVTGLKLIESPQRWPLNT